MPAEIIREKSYKVDRFKKLYAEDRFKARIYAIDQSPYMERVMYNNVKLGTFQIFDEKLNYGVSTTLKLYARKKCINKYLVSPGKFYGQLDRGNRLGVLRPITASDVNNSTFKDVFIRHYSWIGPMVQNMLWGIALNTVYKHKLFTPAKVLRYMFHCDAERAKALQSGIGYHDWKQLRKNVINIQNLNTDIASDHDSLFVDTIKLGFKLNRMVNAAWSERRLRQEHDDWSAIYTNIALEATARPLKIANTYLQFADFLGGGLIMDTKELALEGLRKSHCVASYADKVDRGQCAIFVFKGYTAEVLHSSRSGITNHHNTGDNLLRLNQCRGYKNVIAPEAIINELREKIALFNATLKQPDAMASAMGGKWYSDGRLLPAGTVNIGAITAGGANNVAGIIQVTPEMLEPLNPFNGVDVRLALPQAIVRDDDDHVNNFNNDEGFVELPF